VGTDNIWSYSLSSDAQSLSGGQTVTESFTVTAQDGTTDTVYITVVGTNDPATFSGDTSSTIQENSTSYQVSGQISASDIDGSSVFTQETISDPSGYGQLTISTSGSWTYSLSKRDNDRFDSLDDSETSVSSFTVSTLSGDTASIVITINGQDDFVIASSGYTTGADAPSLGTASEFVWDDLDKWRFSGFAGSYTDENLDYLVGRGAVNTANQTYANFDALHDEVKRVADDIFANFSDSTYAIVGVSGTAAGSYLPGQGSFVIFDSVRDGIYEMGSDQIVYLQNYTPSIEDWDKLFYIPPACVLQS
jgi:VCBS repeat-containing protein